MQSQVNQGQSLPTMTANQGPARQQILSQNIQNGVQGSASLTSSLPTVGGLPQTTMPNVVGQNSNSHNLRTAPRSSLCHTPPLSYNSMYQKGSFIETFVIEILFFLQVYQ